MGAKATCYTCGREIDGLPVDGYLWTCSWCVYVHGRNREFAKDLERIFITREQSKKGEK